MMTILMYVDKSLTDIFALGSYFLIVAPKRLEMTMARDSTNRME